MASSFIQWDGLTKTIHDMQETIPRNATAGISVLTAQTGEDLKRRYQDNLDGASPSTEDNPLPVGRRSGELYDAAQLQILNQYAFRLYNDTPYAGWIEYGTYKMAPRMPMTDAIRQIEDEMDVQLDEVMMGIVE